jgi:fermentation-respiration switch protein FrsA (DUF1100 family)
VVRVALALALGYAGLVAAARLYYRRFLFPAPPDFPLSIPPGATAIALSAADGVTVNALSFNTGSDAPPRQTTIVHFHGNGETIVQNMQWAQVLAARGIRVVLVEYRGYGASAGAPITEDGLYLDAMTALDALAARGTGPRDIVLWGTSLGTGVASEMARRGRGRALVLVTPFTSIPDAAAFHAPFLPMRLIVTEQFDTLSRAGNIRVPTLVVHGTLDEVVPYFMGERVAAAITGSRFIRIDGGHHNDLFERDPHLLREIATFARDGAGGGG